MSYGKFFPLLQQGHPLLDYSLLQLEFSLVQGLVRNYDIKDYSHLIPGHGGILDRFDSIIFTAPIIYYMLVMVVGLK